MHKVKTSWFSIQVMCRLPERRYRTYIQRWAGKIFKVRWNLCAWKARTWSCSRIISRGIQIGIGLPRSRVVCRSILERMLAKDDLGSPVAINSVRLKYLFTIWRDTRDISSLEYRIPSLSGRNAYSLKLPCSITTNLISASAFINPSWL